MTNGSVPTRRWPDSPPWAPAWRLWVLTALVAVAAFAWWNVRQFTTIVVSAVLLAYVVDPVIRRVQARTRTTRGKASVTVYAVIVVLLVALAVLLAPIAAREITSIDPDALRSSWRGLTEAMPARATLFGRTLELGPLYAEAEAQAQRVEQVFVGRESLVWLLGFATDFAFTVFGLFVTIVASLYLSMDADNMARWVESHVPDDYRDVYRSLRYEIASVWQSFFRGQLVLVVVIAVATTLGLVLLGIPYALPLGLLAGALEVIPRVGPIVALVPAVVVAYFQPSATVPDLPKLWFVVLVIGMYLAIQQVENNVLVPRVIGSSVNLSPAVVLLGAIMGASLAGVMGILLAPPLLGSARIFGSWLFEKMVDPRRPPGGGAGGEPLPPWPEGDAARLEPRAIGSEEDPGADGSADGEQSAPEIVRAQRVLSSARQASLVYRRPSGPARAAPECA